MGRWDKIMFPWEKVSKKEGKQWGGECLRLRSLFHPICFVGNCFRDGTISGRHHHSSCPRSRVWDVAIHQGIVDQYWLICVTPGNIGAHLCLSPDSVYVINMEDEKQVSHNFFTLQKAPINHKRGTRDAASRRVVVVAPSCVRTS